MNKLISLCCLIILSACEVNYPEIQAPPKPSSVPETALWVGGPDGGVFLDISKITQQKYSGSIYFDSTGEIWFQGEFKYTGDNSFDVSAKASYSFWDGDELFLTNNEKLTAINPD